MTKARNRSQSPDPRLPQLSLPFRHIDPPTRLLADAQRAAGVALLREMLIEALVTKGPSRTIDHDKENDHE